MQEEVCWFVHWDNSVMWYFDSKEAAYKAAKDFIQKHGGRCLILRAVTVGTVESATTKVIITEQKSEKDV